MESLYKGKLAWYISFVLLLFDMANVLVLLSDLQCACSASGRPRTSAVVENSWVLLVDSQVCSKIPIYLALPIEYFKLWFQLCVCVFFYVFILAHLPSDLLIRSLFCFVSSRPWCRLLWMLTVSQHISLIWRRVRSTLSLDFEVTRCNQNYRLSDSHILIRFAESTSFKKIAEP